MTKTRQYNLRVTPLAVRLRKHGHTDYMSARAQGQSVPGYPLSAAIRASQGCAATRGEAGGLEGVRGSSWYGGVARKRSGSAGEVRARSIAAA